MKYFRISDIFIKYENPVRCSLNNQFNFIWFEERAFFFIKMLWAVLFKLITSLLFYHIVRRWGQHKVLAASDCNSRPIAASFCCDPACKNVLNVSMQAMATHMCLKVSMHSHTGLSPSFKENLWTTPLTTLVQIYNFDNGTNLTTWILKQLFC